mmetsp:Transcript_19365/g.29874  ORF Transcript_19365/g.29874 Transcript_19365/m.29874 type:complete len:276 (+) Transcript_19365:1180-2007(+)
MWNGQIWNGLVVRVTFRRHEFLNHTLHLQQLLIQSIIVGQPTARIDDERIVLFIACLFERPIEYRAGTLSLFGWCVACHLCTIGPHFELLHCSCAECITCCHHDLLFTLDPQPRCQLPNRRSLTHTIGTHDEQHRQITFLLCKFNSSRKAPLGAGVFRYGQRFNQLSTQHAPQIIACEYFRTILAQRSNLFDDFLRRGEAQIGLKQDVLQLFENITISVEYCFQIVQKFIATFGQTLCKCFEIFVCFVYEFRQFIHALFSSLFEEVEYHVQFCAR